MPPRELVNGKAGASCHGNKLIVAHGARLCTCKRIGATRPGRDAATFDKARFELGISEPGVDYVFDLWAERWRLREATGDMIIVRYADDFIVGFQHEADARHFLDAMRERLREFALSHHPGKTPAHRVRTPCGGKPKAARAWQTGDLHLPALHLHLQ